MTKYGGKIQSPEEYITFLEGVVAERSSYTLLPADLKMTHEIARLNAMIRRRDKTIRELNKDVKELIKSINDYKNQISKMGGLIKFLDSNPEIRTHVEAIYQYVDEMMSEIY